MSAVLSTNKSNIQHQKIRLHHPAPVTATILTLAPSACTISKHTTSSNCPTRSMSAECTGSAYISGSRPVDQRYDVRRCATRSDIVTCRVQPSASVISQLGRNKRGRKGKKGHTAQKKNTIENATNRAGRWSHPSARMVPRKAISIGRVTSRSVVVTSCMLGSFLCLE